MSLKYGFVIYLCVFSCHWPLSFFSQLLRMRLAEERGAVQEAPQGRGAFPGPAGAAARASKEREGGAGAHEGRLPVGRLLSQGSLKEIHVATN